MAGESQQTPESVPDPTVLVTDAIHRAVEALRDYVDGQIGILTQRFDDADKATEVLSETVNRTPTEIQREVSHVKELLSTKLEIAESKIHGYRDIQVARSHEVDTRFEHLDKVRGEDKREARSLVDLALASQKELTSTALTSANTAIDKAAAAHDKRYDALDKAVVEMRQGLASMMPRKESEARHTAHEQAVGGLATRIVAIEAMKQGSQERVVEQRHEVAGANQSMLVIVSLLGTVLTVVIIAVMIYAATKGGT